MRLRVGKFSTGFLQPISNVCDLYYFFKKRGWQTDTAKLGALEIHKSIIVSELRMRYMKHNIYMHIWWRFLLLFRGIHRKQKIPPFVILLTASLPFSPSLPFLILVDCSLYTPLDNGIQGQPIGDSDNKVRSHFQI